MPFPAQGVIPLVLPNEKFIPLFQPARPPTADDPGHKRTRYYVYYGGRGGAKCLGRGTEVVMFDGTLRQVQDVRIGEQLLGIDGTPRTVLNTTQGRGPLYRVHQKSGENYVVNEDHVLALKRSKSAREDYGSFSKAGNPQRPKGRYAKYGDDPSLIVAKGFAASTQRFKEHFCGFKSPAIFKSKPLPLDPYFFGLWLGDGDSARAAITTMDEEIVAYLKEFAEDHGMRVSESRKPDNRAACYRLVSKKEDTQTNRLNRKLRELGVLHNKHIPQDYLTGDEGQRLSLLAGFVDTDGHVRHNGIAIVQSRESLLRQLKFLADSLGFKTRMRKADTVCSNNGKLCEAWKLSIDGDVWRIPCRIPRKQVAPARKNKDWRITSINLEPLGEGEFFGFELDGDHLFLLRDFTVTHNSHQFAIAALMRAMQDRIQILCCREIQSSIADSVHKLLSDKIKALELSDFFEILTNEIRCTLTGSSFAFRGLRHNLLDIKSFEGAAICWVEEATNVSEESWDVLDPTIRAEGSEIWVSFNTDLEDDATYRRFVLEADEDVTLVEVNYLDNPLLSASTVKQAEKMRRLHPEKYEHIWGGKPRKNREGGVFLPGKINIIEAAPAGMTLVRGWDFAGTEIDPKQPNKQPDWTVGGRMGRTSQGRFVVDHVVRIRGKPHEVEEQLVTTANNDGFEVEQSIPQDPGQAGKHQVQYFVNKLAGKRVHTSLESGSKITRAESFASQVNVGNVDFVRGAWNDAVLKVLEGFPNGDYDDDVDALGRAFRRLLEPQELQMMKVIGL